MKGLVLCGIALASVVVVLGAYTRLVDAGLGCPDWPGCYGFLSVPASAEEVAAAEARFPDSPVEPDKAWPEMVHRYFAALLGLLALAIWAVAWRQRRAMALPTALVVLVVAQGIFGAWTVTLKLWPQVVTAHLLGGFATLALLWVYALKIGAIPSLPVPKSLTSHTAAAIAVVVLQVAIGGWTSSNYAALACPDFPACHGSLLPDMDFRAGFNLAQDVGPNYLGGTMASDARVAIQMTHRLGAFVVLLVVGWLVFRLVGPLRWILGGVLVVQFCLGIVNVLAQLPLAVATLHNAGAALLLLALVTVYAAAVGAWRRETRAPNPGSPDRAPNASDRAQLSTWHNLNSIR